jgi:sulfonate transport system substrate-binding protein
LLRALELHGLQRGDVEIVHLQHPEGRIALEGGDVDAWAGLDPHMASSQLAAGSRLLYRNRAFNSGGFLNVAEGFAAQHPNEVELVLRAYERARRWALANPGETARVLSEEARQPPEVARLQLQRTDLEQPRIGAEQADALREAAPILLAEALVRPGTDLGGAIDALLEPRFAGAAAAGS